MELAQWFGWAATTLFTACYIPQIIKTRKSGTIEGLSFLLLGISFIANIVAFCYATLISQRPLQVKYTLALIVLSFALYEYYRVFKRGRLKVAVAKE